MQTTRRAIDGIGEEESGAKMPGTIARVDGSTTRHGTLGGAMTGGRRTTSRATRIGVQGGDNDLPPGRAAQDRGRSSIRTAFGRGETGGRT